MKRSRLGLNNWYPKMSAGNFPTFYRNITVTATPVADFQVRVVLTTSNFDYTRVNLDGSNLRFNTSAGMTTGYYSYWIESWVYNGTSVIWVKVPTAGTTLFALTYPNGATAMSDIDATMDAGLRFKYYQSGGVAGGAQAFQTLQGGGIDTVVNYAWAGGTVSISGFGSLADYVSVRWEGWIKPTGGTGSYTLYCISDDGQRMYLDGTMVINNWVDQGPTEQGYTFTWSTSVPKRFTYEFFETGGGANAQVGWTPNGGSKVYPIPYLTSYRAPKYGAGYEDTFNYSATIGSEAVYVPGLAVVSGGTLFSDTTYYYRVFTASSNLVISSSGITADILVIAGGGGGSAGGGGAGGYRTLLNQSVSVGTYAVTIGAGGAADAKGSDSSLGSLLVSTGGGGGKGTVDARNNGGSGGGGREGSTSGGTGIAGQGFNGGIGASDGVSWAAGGGGGGAGAVGADATGAYPENSYGGNGGVGLSSQSSWGLVTSTGQNVSGTVYYAGGGAGTGGGGANGNGGTGGNGGGGQGGASGTKARNSTAGTANTGGGGGGGGPTPSAGGSGLVIIRYTKSQV